MNIIHNYEKKQIISINNIPGSDLSVATYASHLEEIADVRY